MRRRPGPRRPGHPDFVICVDVGCYAVERAEEKRWTLFGIHPTPKGKTWHVERAGKLKTGTGLRSCSGWDKQQSLAQVALLVNRIEAAVTDQVSEAQASAQVLQAIDNA